MATSGNSVWVGIGPGNFFWAPITTRQIVTPAGIVPPIDLTTVVAVAFKVYISPAAATPLESSQSEAPLVGTPHSLDERGQTRQSRKFPCSIITTRSRGVPPAPPNRSGTPSPQTPSRRSPAKIRSNSSVDRGSLS